MIVHVNIGLPGSGKSKWSRDYVRDHPNTIIICRDNLREMVYGNYAYHRGREATIKGMEAALIRLAIAQGHDVILDGCHISQAHRRAVRDIVNSIPVAQDSISLHYEVFPENKCNIEFRMVADKGVSRERWEGVIDGMMGAYEAPTEAEMEDLQISQMEEHPIPDSVVPKSKGWLSPHWQQGVPPDGVPCILTMIEGTNNPNYIFDMATKGLWTKCWPQDVAGWVPVSKLG